MQHHLRPITITHHLFMTQGAKLHARGLERWNAHIPPNALLFHSPSVAWEKVLPVRLVNTASNLQATSKHKIGYQSQLQHLNARSGDTCACILHTPAHGLCATDTYKEDILKLDDIDEMNRITVISSRHLPYLCTQEGYPQGFLQTQ